MRLHTRGNPSAKISKGTRAAALAVATAIAGTFAVAAALVPDARGHGTHEQLGLPPCTFYVWFGRRCPACGMTTAWAYLVRGQVNDALRAHVSGTLVAVGAAVTAVWLGAAAAFGKWLLTGPREQMLMWIACLFLIATLAEWLMRLVAG